MFAEIVNVKSSVEMWQAITALIVLLNAVFIWWSNRENKKANEATAAKVDSSAKEIVHVIEHVKKIDEHTNAMKDAVVAAVKEAALLRGAENQRDKDKVEKEKEENIANKIADGIRNSQPTVTEAISEAIVPIADTITAEIKEDVGIVKKDVKDIHAEVLPPTKEKKNV